MRNVKLTHVLRGSCAVLMLATAASFADPSPTPGNPSTNASDRNYDTNQPNSVPGGVQKMEDGANRGLNKVDNGVHSMGRKTKRGAHKAKRKAGEAVDQMSEPAIKPAK